MPNARRDALNARVAAGAPANLRNTFGDFRLRPYQLNVSTLFVKPSTKGLLLYYKVGSGKTITSIAAAQNLARVEGAWKPVVVICPASLVNNYKKEVEAALRAESWRYRIVSFEHVHALSTAARENLGRDAVLIIDEVQNLRNPLSKRLDSVLQVAKVSHKRLLLSGTPVMNYPRDVGPVLALLKPTQERIERVVKEVTTEGTGNQTVEKGTTKTLAATGTKTRRSWTICSGAASFFTSRTRRPCCDTTPRSTSTGCR